MKLYHFTTLIHAPAIMREGLRKGSVAQTWRDTIPDGGGHCPETKLNGVWLTTSSQPHGHGNHLDPYTDTDGRQYLGKADVRITVDLAPNSKRLVHWEKWSLKNVDPQVRQALIESDGDAWRTWHIYFGVIEPDQFKAIDLDTARIEHGVKIMRAEGDHVSADWFEHALKVGLAA